MNFNEVAYAMHGSAIFGFAGTYMKANFSQRVTQILLDACADLDAVELHTKARIRSIARAQKLDYYRVTWGDRMMGYMVDYIDREDFTGAGTGLLDNVFGPGLFK